MIEKCGSIRAALRISEVKPMLMRSKTDNEKSKVDTPIINVLKPSLVRHWAKVDEPRSKWSVTSKRGPTQIELLGRTEGPAVARSGIDA